MQTGVLIYEDNNQLRESVADLITYSREYVLTGSFPNVLNVEEQVKTLRPEIILMDIDMPGGFTGIDAVRKIRRFDQQTHIIMLTVFDDNTNVLDALCAGATGYLLKKDISSRLMDAMQEILSGGAPMSFNVARMVVANMQKLPSPDREKYQLTTREKEILNALSRGTGYKSIAQQFSITLDTVRSHVKNIYQKMQVHSQLEAVAKARNEGIL